MAAENDPYNTMLDSEKNDIRPGFLGGNGDNEGKGKAAGALSAAEKVASAAMAAKGGGAGAAGGKGGGLSGVAGGAKAGSAKGAMADGLKNAENGEKNPKGLYNKSGNKQNGKDEESSLKMSKGTKTGMKMAIAAMAPLLILFVGMVAILAIIIGLPILMIGTIDYNLMKVLGFEHIIGIIEEVGGYVTREWLTEGKVPSRYFSDLAAWGIDVGQVTANGDFVKTNVYIANIEDRNDLVAAASGFSYIPEDEGELAVLWNGKVIYAGDFVAAVESDPTLYAAYSGAADLDTKYYYGDDVDAVYNEFNLSRGNFNDWESTGDYQKDKENYENIVKRILGSVGDLKVGGVLDNAKLNGENTSSDETGGTFIEDVANSAIDTIESVATNTKEYVTKWKNAVCGAIGTFFKKIGDKCYDIGETSASTIDNAAERATQLLNNVISVVDAFKAAVNFIAIEEPIQRARVDGDGPIHHAMDSVTHGKEVSYQDVETGETKTSDLSIVETKNFKAAVSDSKYDKSEAHNFGRDRVMAVTGKNSERAINSTTIATNGERNSSAVVRNGNQNASNMDDVYRAEETMALSLDSDNAELFQSVVGGNRIIEGGSYLSNSINMQTLGAMPSNEGKIAEYHKEVEKVMARRAEAERATKSPFDISSPNTFLGSIVHNIGMAVIRNYGSGMTALSAVSSAGDTTGRAIANLTGSATAAGGDNEFTTMSGEGCNTLGTVGVEGDLYCNSHNTPSIEHIDWTFDDFKSSEIGDQINDDGTIVDGSELSQFVVLGMDRYSTSGVKNTDICEKYNDSQEGGLLDKVKRWISNVYNKLFGDPNQIYDPCYIDYDKIDKGDEEEIKKLNIYTGAYYTFGEKGNEKNDLFSSYMLYNEVRSLLADEQSAVSVLREDYYTKHPKDNSTAGVIARHSGMSKEEVLVALAYADYLNEIAMYNPSSRFDFTAPVVLFEKPILEYHSDEMALELYAWYSKQAEYDDLRTRNFVV